MPRPSKTDEKCVCEYLERAARNPAHPIEFDPLTNEFQIVHGAGQFIIYHCPFCGGKAPESVRDTLFAHVPDDEQRRLFALSESLKTDAEVVAALGQPDRDDPFGLVVGAPTVNGQSPETTAYRVLTDAKKSDVAELKVHLRRDGAVASVRVAAKYIGGTRKSG